MPIRKTISAMIKITSIAQFVFVGFLMGFAWLIPQTHDYFYLVPILYIFYIYIKVKFKLMRILP